jgi:hypothetical protein
MVDPDTEKVTGEETIVRPRHEVEGGGVALPYFVIVDGPRLGARYPLHEGETLVGRGPWSHILLEDQSVSRRHCMVERDGATVTVRDLGSKNGTRVNGQGISDKVTVGHGDLVQTGIYTVRLITRPVTPEEEMAMDAPSTERDEEVIEGSAETGAYDEEELAEGVSGEDPWDEDQEDDAEVEDADEDQGADEGETMVGEVEVPRSRLRTFLLIGFMMVFLGGAASAGYYFFLREAPEADVPKNLVSRVIPPEVVEEDEEEGGREPQPPSEIPVFLDFAASPMPARIVFLDKDYGQTPIKANVTLKVGEAFTAEGHFVLPEFKEEHVERFTFTVTLDKDRVPVFFRAPIGIFKIEKIPQDVELTLQGFFSYDKFTPRHATLADVSYGRPVYVPYGRYIVELRQPREIGASGQFVPDIRYRREILIGQDSPAFALVVEDAELTQFPVEIRSVPSQASVFMDAKPVGKTPFTGTFPLGEHTLVLQKEGYFEHSQSISNDINVIYTLEVPLKTTEAGQFLNEGHQLILKGRFKEGIVRISGALEKNPTPFETAKARYLLGVAFLGISDFKTARGYFDQAKGHPEFELRAKLGVVRVLTRQEKRLEAIPHLVEVLLRSRDAEIKAEAKATFKEVSPLKSVLYVRSDPPGATVFLNTKEMSTKTPMILHDIGLGSYTVRLELENYLPKEVKMNLTIHEFNPVIVRLKPVEE